MSWFYRILNPTMNGLLRSPAHRIISWRVMTVSYHGRRSGKPYAVPVSYLREATDVYCFTNGRWWHNFKSPRPASLRIQGHLLAGQGVAEPAHTAHNVAVMARYFSFVKADAKFYGVTFDDDGNADIDSVHRAARGMIMIHFAIDDPTAAHSEGS